MGRRIVAASLPWPLDAEQALSGRNTPGAARRTMPDMVWRIEAEAVRVCVAQLPGEIECPPRAAGLVVFAHGSGSSRSSPRTRFVARVLHRHGLATLRFDLLGDSEAESRDKVFDIELLASRLVESLDWLRQRPDGLARGLGRAPVGLFGASTGAAAALQAAAQRPGRVCAVVSRGGRGDLAAGHLARVQAPTLLIVGGADTEVLALNRFVLRTLQCAKRLEVVPGATHLFEEPGALDAVAQLAADWFERNLVSGPALPA
jgi:putative phosphoribosyl transferase